LSRTPLNALTISTEGLEALKKHEAVINGLYDDPSGYATYGVGHLVQKFKSVLLETAKSDKLCDSRIAKKWPGKSYEMPYLQREVVGCADFSKLKTKAGERGPDIVAQAKYGKSLEQLPEKDKVTVRAQAQDALREEVRLLSVTVDSVLLGDLKRFEIAVNEGITSVTLTQAEFDALVSLAFNIGTGGFANSTLRKKINENKYRSGDAAQRKAAIDEIEKAFLAWDKSGGKQLPGLVARRKAEAGAFLKRAREELDALSRSAGAGVMRGAAVPIRRLP
jgi:GH24 family phage-related lysozyme (muramidase)